MVGGLWSGSYEYLITKQKFLLKLSYGRYTDVLELINYLD